jgi:tetratricopeptide (TPR) repeat protein
MTSETDWRTALGVAASVAVPVSLLHALAAEPRRAWGLAAAPFGPPVLLAVQIIFALPLGWVLARALERAAARIGTLAWATSGLIVLATTAVINPAIATGLDQVGASFFVRAILRSALAVMLVAPWLVPATRWAGPSATRPAIFAAPAIGAILAVMPPLAFAYRLTEARSADVAADLDTGRLAKARATLEQLCELGSWKTVGDVSPRELRQSLQAKLYRHEKAALTALPDRVTPAELLQRGFLLTQLGRLAETEVLLKPLADRGDADATLFLAAVYRDQERWSDCERLYGQVLGMSRPRIGTSANAVARCVMAYDGLADALRGSGRFKDVGKVLLEARARLPSRSAYYAFRLGCHDLDTGRPVSALVWFDEAVRRDPSIQSQVQPLIHRARVRTPACLLTH